MSKVIIYDLNAFVEVYELVIIVWSSLIIFGLGLKQVVLGGTSRLRSLLLLSFHHGSYGYLWSSLIILIQVGNRRDQLK